MSKLMSDLRLATLKIDPKKCINKCHAQITVQKFYQILPVFGIFARFLPKNKSVESKNYNFGIVLEGIFNAKSLQHDWISGVRSVKLKLKS